MNNTLDYTKMTREQSEQWSKAIVERLQSGDPGQIKEAAINMTDYLRPNNYEQSFASQILTPTSWDEAERIKALDSDQPMVMIEIEPDTAGAEQVDFGHMAETFYPYGKRVTMSLTPVHTQRIVKNVIELGAYSYNFRTVLTDLLSLQLAFIKDKQMLQAAQRCLAPVGVPNAYTSVPNNVLAGTTWSYGSWQRQLNVMRSTPNSLEPATCLFNHLMIGLMKDQIRQDFHSTAIAEQIFRSGNAEISMPGDGLKMISTIKKKLVLNNEYYFFTNENQLGRYIYMYEPTMLVDNKGLKVSFEIYEVFGMMFINQAGVSKSLFS